MVVGTHSGGNLVCHIVMRNMSGLTITIAHIVDPHVHGSRCGGSARLGAT